MLDTLRKIAIEPAVPAMLDEPHGDYERVRRIIAFISERWRDQPPLEALADPVGLSTTPWPHLFPPSAPPSPGPGATSRRLRPLRTMWGSPPPMCIISSGAGRA